MRLIVVIGLLLALHLPYAGMNLFYQLERKQVQREIKRKLMFEVNPSELVELKFSIRQLPTELNWIHENEFEYRGQMYDIVYRCEQKDSVVFQCWWDKAETELNQQVRKLTAFRFHSKHESDLKTTVLSELNELEYPVPELLICPSPVPVYYENNGIQDSFDELADHQPQPASPPPESLIYS